METKTKEQVIAQKWIETVGETKYNEIKSFIDKKGLMSKHQLVKYKIEPNGFKVGKFTCYPKSLSGIETNNGWVKIESEDENLKDWLTAWVYSSMVEYGTWNPHQEYWQDVEGYPIKDVTHYQPIEKPQPPLY